MEVPEVVFDWRSRLRWWRLQSGMSQMRLAAESGLSVAAVRAYESGARQPSRHALESVIATIGIPSDQANEILAAAGYAAEWAALFDRRLPPVSLDELSAESALYAWPAFVTNQSFDVVGANKPFARLFDIDLETGLTEFGERNLLGGITHESLAGRLLNWDEVVAFMCGLAKGDPRWAGTELSTPAPWLKRPIERFLQGSPARIQRFLEIWGKAGPIPHRIRYQYRIDWQYPDANPMRFTGRMMVADVWSELHWNEWIPADSHSWATLERITAG